MSAPKWKLKKVKVSDLKEWEKNPRQMNVKQYQDLKTSIEKFGIVEKPIVNQDMTMIGGHQRKQLMEKEGIEEVEVWIPDRQLDEKELEEFAIRLNKNTGEWDMDILANMFDPSDLKNYGFSDKEIPVVPDDLEEKFNAIDDSEATYPITPKFTEKYEAVIIFADNTLDMNWLRNVLDLKKKQSYKNSQVGECQVITVKEFQKIWQEKAGEKEVEKI